MRDRAPPRAAGLLDGHKLHKHRGKRARNGGRTLLKLVAAFLVSIWLLVLYRHSHPSGRGKVWSLSRLLGLGSSESSSEMAGQPALSALAEHGEEDNHERRSSRHKRRKKESGEPECTDSPLKEKEAFPVYGCDEMQVRASERARQTDRQTDRESYRFSGGFLVVFLCPIAGAFLVSITDLRVYCCAPLYRANRSKTYVPFLNARKASVWLCTAIVCIAHTTNEGEPTP